MTIQQRVENLESINRGQLEALKTSTRALQGLQKQVESLARLSQLLFGAVQAMAGGEADAPTRAAVEEISEKARREIEELERLYGAAGGEGQLDQG